LHKIFSNENILAIIKTSKNLSKTQFSL